MALGNSSGLSELTKTLGQSFAASTTSSTRSLWARRLGLLVEVFLVPKQRTLRNLCESPFRATATEVVGRVEREELLEMS